jgi:hypothetical protein
MSINPGDKTWPLQSIISAPSTEIFSPKSAILSPIVKSSPSLSYPVSGSIMRAFL